MAGREPSMKRKTSGRDAQRRQQYAEATKLRDLPARCRTNEIDPLDLACLRCGADIGEACKDKVKGRFG